jgi:tetratricopeptide (TPR) repeat protein
MLAARCSALEVAEELVDADPHDAGTRRDLAFVLKDLGNLLARDGDTTLAREHLQRALDLTETLATEAVGSARARRDLSVCLIAWGLAEQRAGRFDSARRALERASTLRHVVADADRNDAQAQRDVAASFIKLADLEEQAGNATAAREHQRRAADIESALLLQGCAAPSRLDARSDPMLPETRVHDRPSIPTNADDLDPPSGPTPPYIEAVCQAGDLEQLGTDALESGNLETARQSLRLMTAITNVLAQVDPEPSVARRRAVSALRQLGQVERQLGELESARSRFCRCCRILDALLQAKPTDLATRRELALCHRELGMVEWALGNLERARDSLQRSTTGLEALVESPLGNLSILQDYWGALVALGRLEAEAQDLETAHELFECGLNIAQEIKERQPNTATPCSEVLQVLCLLVDIEVRLGNPPEAWLRRLLEEVKELVHPDEDALAALDLVLRYAERSTPAA